MYGFKFYPWARKVWDSTNREIFLCSANQVGKSTIAIRRNIHLATSPEHWGKYWPELPAGNKPNLFWYLYPTFPVAQAEFESKWEPLFLPRGSMKNHPIYGWKEEYDKGYIQKIRFNSGVTIQFKAYAQKVKDLQTATVYHVTADEEMPVEILPELKARLNATGGVFMMVFTATMGQQYWEETMEHVGRETERHKNALKVQVSLYDSQKFDDGTPSHWTDKKIQAAVENCTSDSEIQRRIFGKFVRSEGKRFEAFSINKNTNEKPAPISKEWSFYGGVDPGTGGLSGHPTAMVIVAVAPDFRKGKVFRAWRGDGVSTTSSDILEQWRVLKTGLALTGQVYDYAAKDFFLVAQNAGEAFVPADKDRESGYGLLNTLFRSEMLSIDRGDPELEKLITELMSLPIMKDKRKAKDDLVDALRYTVKAIPWDMSGGVISGGKFIEPEKVVLPEKTTQDLRREFALGLDLKKEDLDEEFDFWNEMSGS